MFPTTGPTTGIIDDGDDKPSDEAAEAEMGDSDVTDDDSDNEDMEADAADADHVRLLLVTFLVLVYFSTSTGLQCLAPKVTFTVEVFRISSVVFLVMERYAEMDFI